VAHQSINKSINQLAN